MSSHLTLALDELVRFWASNGIADVFKDASKGFAALFNTVLEFTGQQAVPNVLGK